jgi:Skp family chaperone for outer membrane proteins
MLAWLQRLVAGALVALCVLFYYEGVPGLPFLEGRVASVARAAAKDALKGYVLQSEKDALAARLAEERRQRLAGAQALEEFRKRAAAELTAGEAERLKLEKAIEEDNRNDDGPRVSPDDIEWLRQHAG